MTPEPQPRQAADPQGALWLADLLWRLGCVQFGDFSVGRTARNSPVYLNPKLLVSRPDALARVARLIEVELQMAMAMRNRQVDPFEVIAAVPIGGLHVGTALSLQMGLPLVYPRPSLPGLPSGSRTHIEGVYRPGQMAVIVDDLATGGGSLIETADNLRQAGLHVKDAVVLINREQGAARRLADVGVRLHPILTLEVLLTYLREQEHVPDDDFQQSIAYLRREGEARSEYD